VHGCTPFSVEVRHVDTCDATYVKRAAARHDLSDQLFGHFLCGGKETDPAAQRSEAFGSRHRSWMVTFVC
jgi:hypothetical protein